MIAPNSRGFLLPPNPHPQPFAPTFASYSQYRYLTQREKAMKDQIDRANELAEKEREFALAKHRQNRPGCSATHCQDCNEPIPEARRQTAKGCIRCIDCQEIYEYQQKGYRK